MAIHEIPERSVHAAVESDNEPISVEAHVGVFGSELSNPHSGLREISEPCVLRSEMIGCIDPLDEEMLNSSGLDGHQQSPPH